MSLRWQVSPPGAASALPGISLTSGMRPPGPESDSNAGGEDPRATATAMLVRMLKEDEGQTLSLLCVFPVEPQRPNGKNINLHKKWGFRRFQKECRKVPKSAENRTFCAFFVHFLAQKVRFSALFGTFRPSFWNRQKKTPLFVQINVFAVWPLRLDRKYTK